MHPLTDTNYPKSLLIYYVLSWIVKATISMPNMRPVMTVNYTFKEQIISSVLNWIIKATISTNSNNSVDILHCLSVSKTTNIHCLLCSTKIVKKILPKNSNIFFVYTCVAYPKCTTVSWKYEKEQVSLCARRRSARETSELDRIPSQATKCLTWLVWGM